MLIPNIVLFNITNVDKGTEGTLRKFAGDVKLGRVGDILECRAAPQRDFSNLEECAGRKDVMFKGKHSPAPLEITPQNSTG